MKTFFQLDDEKQEKAVKTEINRILLELAEGTLVPNDKTLIEGIEAAKRNCEANKTPWFLAEAIYEEIGHDVRRWARESASEAIYIEAHEWVIRGIA